MQTPQGEVPRKFQMLYTCNICDGRNLITVRGRSVDDEVYIYMYIYTHTHTHTLGLIILLKSTRLRLTSPVCYLYVPPHLLS